MPTLAELSSGQPRVVEALRAAFQSGRMHHAYILVGQQPAVSRELALAAAQALVCESPAEGSGCAVCSGCRKLAGGNHPDVLHVRPNEKGVIPIDVIREVSGRLSLRAVEARVKVVVLEGADHMNPNAQNALLKTLEEPPGPTCFFLTCTRFRNLLPTVRSRSQRLRLAPPARKGGAEALVAGGVDPSVAGLLSALVGADVEAAADLVERGAVEVAQTLRDVLAAGTPAASVADVAADLGADAARTDLALALLEVELRDRLAAGHGAAPSALYDDSPRAPLVPADVAATVDRVIELRELTPFNLNRTLSLESVLLRLTGHLAAGP